MVYFNAILDNNVLFQCNIGHEWSILIKFSFEKLSECRGVDKASSLTTAAELWPAHHDEVKHDLLFRPSTSDLLRLSAKSNEKLDLIQQQHREQMLLQSTTPTHTCSLEMHMGGSLAAAAAAEQLACAEGADGKASVHGERARKKVGSLTGGSCLLVCLGGTGVRQE